MSLAFNLIYTTKRDGVLITLYNLIHKVMGANLGRGIDYPDTGSDVNLWLPASCCLVVHTYKLEYMEISCIFPLIKSEKYFFDISKCYLVLRVVSRNK
jgi:hypothetical protein